MRGRSDMRLALFCFEIGTTENLWILWVIAFNALVVVPSPIFYLWLRSYGLISKCISLDVKILWEGKSWCRPSKTSYSRSVILVLSGTLASAILTCDTSLILMKDGSCTVLRSRGSISVLWTFILNASTQISVIPTNKYSSSSMCDPFRKQTKQGSQSCGDVKTICGQASNFCYVGDKVTAQTIVPYIYSVTVTYSLGHVIPIGFCIKGFSFT